MTGSRPLGARATVLRALAASLPRWSARPPWCCEIHSVGPDARATRVVAGPWRTEIRDEEVASTLLSRALQNTFCHRFAKAAMDLKLWPQPSRSKMTAVFVESSRKAQ